MGTPLSGKVMAISVTREDGNSTVCWFGSLVSGLILVFSLLANLLLKFLLTLSGAPQCNVNWNSAGCSMLEVAVLFINIFDKVVGGGGGPNRN